MKKRTAFLVSGLLLAVALAAGAEGAATPGPTSGPTLGQTTAPAKIDGVFSAGEYSVVTEEAGMKIGLTLTGDTLFVGLSAPTTGWVALGLGAGKMDGAVMYIGYVSGSETQLKVQKGTGHRHADFDGDAPRQYVMKETGGQTVLEIAVKPTGLIARGQKSLDVLAAMGSTDSFVSFHKARAAVSVALAP